MMAGYDDPFPVRLTEGDRERVEQYAEDEGLTLSEAARRLIDRGLLVEMDIQQKREESHAAD